MAKSGAAIGQGLRREGRPGWRSSHPPHLRRPCAGAPPRPRWCDPVLSPAKDLFASAGKCVLCELMRYRWSESVAPSLQCVRGVSPHLPLAFCVARAPERRALATPRVRSVTRGLTAGRSRSVGTTIESRSFRAFACVNRREPVRIYMVRTCEYASVTSVTPKSYYLR